MGKVLRKVFDCQTQLKLLDKKTFVNIRIALARKRKELLQAKSDSMAERDGHARIKALTDEVHKLMEKEECMWHQHLRTDWLKFGDQNTKYFHCRAIERNKRNFITSLENEQGIWVEGEDQIGNLVTRYYSSLFTMANPTNFAPVLNGVKQRVSTEMNDELLKSFMEDKVKHALKQMDANTTLRPDGLPPLFYKQFWGKIGKEVSEAVLAILNSSTILTNLNHTFITLIPKIKCPRKVSDFKPISLSNVLYKLIAKVLANRLKHLLPKLISETQRAFLSERLITDNVLIAHETRLYLKEKRTGKMGYMALKLDMRKVYDRVEWVYLEMIMEKMSFSPR